MVRLRSTGSVICTLIISAAVLFAAVTNVAAKDAPSKNPSRDLAQHILEATGLTGGFIVHVGCGDGQLTAALKAGEQYLVHGLDADAENVDRARRFIKSAGQYGNVSVDRFDGRRLPYVDNLVNLVVAKDLGDVTTDEVMRVLCPGGTAYLKSGAGWTKTVKPRPAKIDDWTHYLYDAQGNAVSQDELVGPPRHFRWTGSPRWARHHDRRASVSAMVSCGGRIFYIFDEGSTASIMLPPKTVLIARDAFNGTILWKRDIPTWHTHLWPFKSGPTQLQRRLVAVGDTVYVTLGRDAPLLALDAETGQTIRTYDKTTATEEVLYSEGVLFILVNETPQSYDGFQPEDVALGDERDRVMVEFPWDENPRRIQAVRADTGELLWQKETRVVPLSMAADRSRVYFHDGDRLAAIDRRTGKEIWQSDPVERIASIPANIMPVLVVYDDVVLFYGATRVLTGVSAATGEVLWTGDHPKSGHYCPEDVLVAGGLVWGGEIAGGKDSGVFVGRDPKTGEIKSQFPPDVEIFFMHQRCYRSKATDRYLIPSWTGTEFIDFRNEHWITNHWVRGGCIYGVMPANGMIYTTPHDCACYMQAKLYGFCALDPAREEGSGEGENGRGGDRESAAPRLERGPTYEPTAYGLQPTASSSPDWPTYRGDPARSGFSSTPVPADLKQGWRTELGGRLSAPVVADGLLLVAEIDAHTVHALDVASGKPVWSFTTGGRVDSPPTVYQNRVLFGSADGYVYSLSAKDGTLAWRFRAAPEERRMTSFEQVESVWPVSGSVLVEDGVVYCVAGRSMFLDGGLRYLRINADTGQLIGEVIFDEHDPETGENLQSHVKTRAMPVGLPDVLSSDGKYLYMRSQQFDHDGNRYYLPPHSAVDAEQGAVQKGETAHLFSPTGFLDDTWWHRSYWVYGRSFAEGAGGWPQAGKNAPGGRILCFDQSNVYGFGRKPVYYKWRTPMEYHLFAAARQPEIIREWAEPRKPGDPKREPPVVHPEYQWSRSVPLLARAMVLADETLFIAGPPDVLDEEEAFSNPGDSKTNAALARQDAALAGEQGALLWAVSAKDGSTLAEQKLDSLPIFDGMIAAAGRLFMVTAEGEVICFSESN